MTTINESLNSVYKLEELGKDTQLHQMGTQMASMVGGTNFRLYKMDGDSGYMIHYHSDGMDELHHVDSSMNGGYLKNDVKPSLKFVSTYKNKIKEIVDSGTPVRIVAHHVLADQLHSLGKRLITKNPDYSMSEPNESVHPLAGVKLKSWVIDKK